MVETDERSRFSHAIALHHYKAKPSPEFFCLGIKRCAARYERPEFQTEFSVNAAKLPPSFQRIPVFRPKNLFLKFFKLAFHLEIALNLVLQNFQNARDCCYDRDALSLDCFDYVRRVERV